MIGKAGKSGKAWSGGGNSFDAEHLGDDGKSGGYDFALPKTLPQLYSQDFIQPFRLGMYWENGYLWQESRREKRYCAQCKRSCRNGDSLWVRKCNRRSSRQYFVKVDNTLRPNNNRRVCVTRTGDRKIRLYKCVGSTRQEWNGIDFGRNFELTAGQSNEKCLSQHHHPKEREVLYMETCKLARLSDTSYWITR